MEHSRILASHCLQGYLGPIRGDILLTNGNQNLSVADDIYEISHYLRSDQLTELRTMASIQMMYLSKMVIFNRRVKVLEGIFLGVDLVVSVFQTKPLTT